MKPDDFEKQIQRQPLKKIPGEWRAEIVRQASRLSSLAGTKKTEPGKMPVPLHILREFFWPNPKAWAGLAVVWVFIFALNFSMRDKTPVLAEKVSPPSPEVLVELKKQQRMFAELMGSAQTPDADRPKVFSPRPRSERVEILTA